MVALFAGNLHHHHDHGVLDVDGHCAACTLHISGVANVPLVFTPIPVISEVEIPLSPCHSITPRSLFLLSSASRAPPITPA
jgi:hypothetical protein